MKKHLPVLSYSVALLSFVFCYAPCAFGQTSVANPARYALLIDNAGYATASAGNATVHFMPVLESAGFKVTLLNDADAGQMAEAITGFMNRLADEPSVGLFYFAGSAIQQQGANYLIPLNADIFREQDIEFNSIGLAQILDEFRHTRSQLNIILLDAVAQTDLWPDMLLSDVGLAEPAAALIPANTLLAFSAEPGTTMSPVPGAYLVSLVEHLKRADTPLEEALKSVRKQVAQATGNGQVPWSKSNLAIDFDFRPVATMAMATTAPDLPKKPDAIELEHWQTAKSDDSVELLSHYLNKYPRGYFAADARQALQALNAPPAEPRGETIAASRNLTEGGKPAAEESLFWESLDQGDHQEVQIYLDAYPKGFYAADAQRLLREVTPPAKDITEDITDDITAWNTIKSSTDHTDYSDFISRFPRSRFNKLAQLRLAKLQPEMSPSAAADVAALLDRARAAMAKKKLTTPADDNAVKWAEQALTINPVSEPAHVVLRDVVDRYLAWSRGSVSRGHAAKAASYLDRARGLERYASADQLAAFGEIGSSVSALRRTRARTATQNAQRSSDDDEPQDGFWSSIRKRFNGTEGRKDTSPLAGHNRL